MHGSDTSLGLVAGQAVKRQVESPVWPDAGDGSLSESLCGSGMTMAFGEEA